MSQVFMVPGTYDENLAHVESGDVASRNYAEGEFLTWKGVLHSVKTAISTGETLVEGTNVQDESDGGLANALSSKTSIAPFSRNEYGQYSQSRNGSTIIFTAPEDCLVFVMVNIAHNNGGGFMDMALDHSQKGRIGYTKVYSGAGTLSAIVEMKSGEKLSAFSGFSNNAGIVSSCKFVAY